MIANSIFTWNDLRSAFSGTMQTSPEGNSSQSALGPPYHGCACWLQPPSASLNETVTW